jgi:hypothetical protein
MLWQDSWDRKSETGQLAMTAGEDSRDGTGRTRKR